LGYWFFKWIFFAWACRLLFRPRVRGAENVPAHGPAILVCNHLSSGETFMFPAMLKRRLTFPAKAEMFVGQGPRERLVAWFLSNVGQVPMDRSGGRASASSMDGVLGVLRHGELLCIFPEGTRSVDGRLYKGKTGVARLVLQANVPVIPVGFVDTEWAKTPLGIPWMVNPVINIGPPLDFSAYAAGAGDRDILRWVTDEIMAAVQQQSGQVYVDAYGTSVKAARAEGRHLNAPVLDRPGQGRPVPPVPAPRTPPAAPTGDKSDSIISDMTSES
jgi:1-acyl-sn-glycerol-3-phosphate acyltransferase